MGRPHSPATAATWGRHLLNPETSPALRRCLFRLVTTNESTKSLSVVRSMLRLLEVCTYRCQIKHSSHTVFPSHEKVSKVFEVFPATGRAKDSTSSVNPRFPCQNLIWPLGIGDWREASLRVLKFPNFDDPPSSRV